MTAIRAVLLLCLGISCSAVHASTVWDESTSGDLSGDPNAPTVVDFFFGSNIIIGSVAATADTRDYITFKVDSGFVLQSILLLNYFDLDTGGIGNTGFHAIVAGATSYIPDFDTMDLFLGGDHLNTLPSGTDTLPLLAAAPLAGTGFDVPLPAGSYTYVIQQTGPQNTGYALDFVIRKIPLPPAFPLFFAALGVLGLLVRSN